jgi:hypothetical protein
MMKKSACAKKTRSRNKQKTHTHKQTLPKKHNRHLRRAVALAHGHAAALDRLKVDGDCKRHADLVGARVALADGVAGRVHNVAQPRRRQLRADGGRQRVELLLLHQGEHGRLDGRDERRELEHGARLVALARVVAVLKHAVQDAADAKRRLDDRRHERAAREALGLPRDVDHRRRHLDGLAVDDDLAGLARVQVGLFLFGLF